MIRILFLIFALGLIAFVASVALAEHFRGRMELYAVDVFLPRRGPFVDHGVVISDLAGKARAAEKFALSCLLTCFASIAALVPVLAWRLVRRLVRRIRRPAGRWLPPSTGDRRPDPPPWNLEPTPNTEEETRWAS